jgi:nucleoside-triphosphatase THEP1
VVVVNKLGKMQPASAAFRDAVSVLLDRDVTVVATAGVQRHPFTDAAEAASRPSRGEMLSWRALRVQ